MFAFFRAAFFFLVRSVPAALLGSVYALALPIYSARVVIEGYQLRLFLAGFSLFILCRGGAYGLRRAGFKWPVLAYPAAILIMVLMLALLRLPSDYPGPSLIPNFSRDESLSIQGDARLGNQRVKLDYEVRDGTILYVNHAMEKPIEVPPGSVARFAVGVTAEPGAAPFHLAVFVRKPSESAPAKVFSTLIERDRSRWEEVEADFSDHSGPQIISIQVTTTGDESDPGWIYVSRLRWERKAGDPARPNLVLIVVDTLRPDHLTSYGYSRRETDPFLRELFEKQGVKFDFCLSTSSWTTPAVASIFTGLYPAEHGLGSLSHMMLRNELTVLAELLQNAGYQTAAFSLSYPISPSFNFSQGFDQFFDLSRFMFHWDGDLVAADRAAQWLDRHQDQPFFLYFHFMNPHYPYSVGPFFTSRSPRLMESLITENAIRSALANIFSKLWFPDPLEDEDDLADNSMLRAYDGEIQRTDRALQRVINALESAGVMDHTLVIITADHGEEFNDHGGFYHKTTLYQELIHVPLFIIGPMIKTPGAVISCPVSLIDIMPTILESAGMAAPGPGSGKSLWPLVQDGVCPDRVLFSELDNRDSEAVFWEAAIKGGLKLIRKRKDQELAIMRFDLETNPRELPGFEPTPREQAWKRLTEELDQLARSRTARERELEKHGLSEQQLNVLRSLGYFK